jgi:hypothetical protein
MGSWRVIVPRRELTRLSSDEDLGGWLTAYCFVLMRKSVLFYFYKTQIINFLKDLGGNKLLIKQRMSA